MTTVTGNIGLTVMQMVFELAGLPVAQLILEVSWQTTQSPFDGV